MCYVSASRKSTTMNYDQWYGSCQDDHGKTGLFTCTRCAAMFSTNVKDSNNQNTTDEIYHMIENDFECSSNEYVYYCHMF